MFIKTKLFRNTPFLYKNILVVIHEIINPSWLEHKGNIVLFYLVQVSLVYLYFL